MDTTQRPKSLVIIRHAESLRNKIKKNNVYFPDEESRAPVRGIPDHKIPLTEEGIIQAQKTGLNLQNVALPDYIYHSGYERTIQTMNYILEAYSAKERSMIKIRTNLFIRERDPGVCYDMTTQEA